MIENEENINTEDSNSLIKVGGMYKEWFLDYASYVILERAVPDLMDGLKPVQRRILHSMFDLEDGRYNKVANVVGHKCNIILTVMQVFQMQWFKLVKRNF